MQTVTISWLGRRETHFSQRCVTPEPFLTLAQPQALCKELHHAEHNRTAGPHDQTLCAQQRDFHRAALHAH
eukprot:SAG25_NODE_660_length_6096_cov_2.291764_6_plen_71_part_00